MSGYTKFGFTQLKDSDFEGWTKEQLEQRFKDLRDEVVSLIVKRYAVKEVKEPKKSKDKNA
jgi:hypothetical protein